MDPDTVFGIPPMRSIDHVEVDLAQGFWYRSTGWKDWILQTVFVALAMTCAVLTGTNALRCSWWLEAAVIVAVMLLLNASLKRPTSR